MADEPLILVVDDEPGVGAYIAATLARNGFKSLLADGGRTALMQFEARKEKIDLVLTDVLMSDLPGPDLVRELRKIRDGVPILYMTGYGMDHLKQFAGQLAAEDVIRKPFIPEELIRAVRLKIGKATNTAGSQAG